MPRCSVRRGMSQERTSKSNPREIAMTEFLSTNLGCIARGPGSRSKQEASPETHDNFSTCDQGEASCAFGAQPVGTRPPQHFFTEMKIVEGALNAARLTTYSLMIFRSRIDFASACTSASDFRASSTVISFGFFLFSMHCRK